MIIDIIKEITVKAMQNKSHPANQALQISAIISNAWEIIAPLWPLQTIIARNPLSGFEDKKFFEAIAIANELFAIENVPDELRMVNIHTIKWCEAFFDQGQASLPMPNRNLGFYKAWRELCKHDKTLHQNNEEIKKWLASLPKNSEETVELCLQKLKIPVDSYQSFITIMLAMLPGWAGYIKYQLYWKNDGYVQNANVELADLLAIRLVISCILWPHAAQLLKNLSNVNPINAAILKKIKTNELKYQKDLLKKLYKPASLLKNNHEEVKNEIDAQLVFCIDVRSEPFRRALEAEGKYQTFGFAGFFGVPISVRKLHEVEYTPLCPVLIAPQHYIKEENGCSHEVSRKDDLKRKLYIRCKRVYQSLKYTFSTPFALAEILGPWAGLNMLFKTFSPLALANLKNGILQLIWPPIEKKLSLLHHVDKDKKPELGIPIKEQCAYAENGLRMMGLTKNFAPVVIFCGHNASTTNNPYASALDCGACGGRAGGNNAKVFAEILNNSKVRQYLINKNINIPANTVFMAAEHNTTTDKLVVFANVSSQLSDVHKGILVSLENSLKNARLNNASWRLQQMENSIYAKKANVTASIELRSVDWAQTRPEWGLARNASFIIGPRKWTEGLDLEGRAFLHSYDWQIDKSGKLLETILTAPMIVAQWINCQYLFSTLHNVVYGSGSKITQSISGKIGIMQGNASDLMHGLPLQSVYISNDNAFHEPMRLLVCLYAPRSMVSSIISRQVLLRKLFANEWVKLVTFDPIDQSFYSLNSDLNWLRSE
jgi:uncharacterized protein YbcC (UPF0753/DUF2309 family)